MYNIMKERQTKILETTKNRIFCQKFPPMAGVFIDVDPPVEGGM